MGSQYFHFTYFNDEPLYKVKNMLMSPIKPGPLEMTNFAREQLLTFKTFDLAATQS